MDQGDELFPAKNTSLFPDFVPEVDDEYITDSQILLPCDFRWLIVSVRFERNAK
jgi:hypothetical protein